MRGIFLGFIGKYIMTAISSLLISCRTIYSILIVGILIFLGVQTVIAGPEIFDCPTDDQLKLDKNSSKLNQIRRNAYQGAAEAQTCLGELHLWGWGVATDHRKAWVFFQQAAQSGNARAMHRTGSMYEQGIYVNRDYKKALSWHLRAAHLGYAAAQSDTGIFYEDGLAEEQNIDAALFWYEKAAAAGEPFAIEALRRLSKK
jgi:uncharacterized protein